MRQFGLIGKTLKHSFSKKYFTDKFESQSIEGCQYDLFEIAEILEFPALIKSIGNRLAGLNVTIPYKKEVMPYLTDLDENAKIIEAVNTIKILPNGDLVGYNTDYYGFYHALKKDWDIANKKALILGTGGAAQAVKKVLTDLEIPYQSISRQASKTSLSYDELLNSEWVAEHELIINTTPLGTYPNISEKPNLPYHQLSTSHLLFDLVYNPEVTAFLQEGLKHQAKIKNGYEMLVGQAEASWKIWNEK